MIESFISFLNHLPSIVVFLFEFFTLFALLIVMAYLFREIGLYVFITVVMIAANIQVLKSVEYTFYSEPIALGKMAICFTFLVSNVLAECFGRKSAYKGILLCFFANFSLIVLMLITIGYPPITFGNSVNFHEHLRVIFTPAPGVFFASVISFMISHFMDISAFLQLKNYFKDKYLWFRAFCSNALASLVDNITFYTLALYIFNDFFIDFQTLIYSYILGTLIFRIFITIFSSIIIYAAKYILLSPKIHRGH